MSTPHEDEIRLNNDIVKEAISIKEGLPCSDTVENVSYEVRMGSEKGDNFTCTIFALSAKGTIKGSEEKTYEFIAKVIPVEPSRVDFVKYSRLNATEVFFYKKIAPTLREYATKYSELKVFFPEVYHIDEEAGVFIFENFKTQGYKMRDRKVGLDEAHINIAFTRLAAHHTLTYHYIQENGTNALEEAGILRKGWLLETPIANEIMGYMNTLIQTISGVVATKDEALSNDLNTFFGAKNPADCINELLAKQSPMQLVLHGDGWVNNFLFKYNEKGDPIDMVAVDFQISRVGDPCQDVSHLMFPCTSPKERKEKWEAWLCHYYKSLKTHMKIMGYELESLYPEESMKKSFEDYRVFGFMLATFMSMHMLTDEAKEGGSMDMDNFKGQELSDVMQSTDKTIESILKCDNSLKQRLVDLAREAKENGIF
uniref:CHK kinase-like domain-containing protein n=1 Tax=Lepeophtheirus salmonis TaxID=72036 RepID=A0A0K2UA87_LEPSM